jgi:SanA protein
LIARFALEQYAHPLIFSPGQAPPAPIAIVFGAGLTRSGAPTPVLRDRIETAADLYFSGKVQKLLMSGDNRFDYYNEPGAMRQYALELGVPDDAIALDFAGRRTYDTCYRAKAIFEVKEAILVTQKFHLPRALYTCNQLGLHANGVTADHRSYRTLTRLSWQIRELPASLVALSDVLITHPLPVLGQPEPIFPDDPAAYHRDPRGN